MYGSGVGTVSKMVSLTPKFLAKIDLGVWMIQSSTAKVVLWPSAIVISHCAAVMEKLPYSIKVPWWYVRIKRNNRFMGNYHRQTPTGIRSHQKALHISVSHLSRSCDRRHTLDGVSRSLWKVPNVAHLQHIHLIFTSLVDSRYKNRSSIHIAPLRLVGN